MKELILLVGPAGAGKTTIALSEYPTFTRISQDEQGKEGHLKAFKEALERGENIVVDRMGFSKEQRARYIAPAKELGYTTKIVVLHVPSKVCMERMLKRENHPTITTEKSAGSALNTFFTKYEKPTQDESDTLLFVDYHPAGHKPKAIWCDLDNSLCKTSHRDHFLQSKPKDWKSFFSNCDKDELVIPVYEIIHKFDTHEYDSHDIVYCSGRPDTYRTMTQAWLEEHNCPEGELFMRARNDFRPDSTIKEIILDFEVLPQYRVLFCIDDRDMVVRLLRSRGLTVLQPAYGDF